MIIKDTQISININIIQFSKAKVYFTCLQIFKFSHLWEQAYSHEQDVVKCPEYDLQITVSNPNHYNSLIKKSKHAKETN